MEPNWVLRRYVKWCENCLATVQIEICKLTGFEDRWVCRRCGGEIERKENEQAS
jgi:rRNA maturation endonuclease Nob1